MDLNAFGNSLIALGTPDTQAMTDYYANASNNRGALGQVITNSQALFNAQVSPLTSALSSQIGAQAGLTNSVAAFGNSSAKFMSGQAMLNSMVPQMIQDQNAVNQNTLLSFQSQISASNQMNSALFNQVAQDNYNLGMQSIQASINASNQSANASINTPPPQTGGGGGSFIITAFVQHSHNMGLPVDDDVVSTMVKFKDVIVYNHKEWRKKLFVYYRVAPILVDYINSLDYKNEVFAYLSVCYIKPCYWLIKNQKYTEAFNHYVKMVESCADICGIDLSEFKHEH